MDGVPGRIKAYCTNKKHEQQNETIKMKIIYIVFIDVDCKIFSSFSRKN